MMHQDALVPKQLTKAIQQEYRQIAELPFSQALASGELPLVSYVGLLRALSIVYEVLEHVMAETQNARLIAVWNPALRKLALIDRDLGFLQRSRPPQTPVAVLRAHLLSQPIRARAHDEPLSLLGYLFVFASPLLSEILRPSQLGQALQIDESNGLAYLTSFAANASGAWQTCTQHMQDVIAPGDNDTIIAAAAEAIAGLRRILEALYPHDVPVARPLTRELNPAAGNHDIPSDPRELQAALRAGEHSWRYFPYYEKRYGERGAQFTRSDSAWLVTLTDHSQLVVNQQIGWLGRVLAARGMPQWMLELHLTTLYDELVAAIPERQATYARLQVAAQALHAQRQHYLSDQDLASYSARFDQAVSASWRTQLPHTGALLAAAVADERSGITQAVTSIETWLTDEARFPPDWIAAVRATLSDVRAHIAAPE